MLWKFVKIIVENIRMRLMKSTFCLWSRCCSTPPKVFWKFKSCHKCTFNFLLIILNLTTFRSSRNVVEFKFNLLLFYLSSLRTEDKSNQQQSFAQFEVDCP